MKSYSEKYLIMIHEYLKEIMSVSSEDEIRELIRKYSSLADKSNAALSVILNDGAIIAKELIDLKNNRSYCGNDKKISALSLDERLELEETER